MRYVDTHCHFNHDDLYARCETAIDRAAAAGVERFVVVGYDLVSSVRAVELSERFERVFAAIGVHPHDASSWNEDTASELSALAGRGKVVAIGEIGLDYYRDHSPRDLQRAALIAQLRLASRLDLPVIFHCRDAYPELLAALETERPDRLCGALHCFSGDLDQAQRAITMGLHIGIGGPVTFKNADALRQTAAGIPADRLLTETDAPYLSPHPYRGKPNEPAYLPLIARKLAEVLGLTDDEFAAYAWENAEELFGFARWEKPA